MPKRFFLPSNALKTQNKSGELLSPTKVRELAFCSEAIARSSLKVQEAIDYQILPLSVRESGEGEEVLVISDQDLSYEKIKELEFLTSKKIKQVSHTKGQDLSAAIYQAYKADDQALQTAKVELLAKADFSQSVLTDSLDFLSEVKNIESKFVHRLIEYSIAREASDLHLIPTAQGLVLKIRIAGEIYQHQDLVADSRQSKMIANHLKVLASLKSSESRLPQDGAFYFETIKTARWIRISTMPTVYGEKIVLRLPKENFIPSLGELGCNTFTEKALRSAIRKSSGMILIVGATGGGKTTTLYSLMQELAGKNLSLVSIEDPVEINLKGIDQSSINPEIGFDYARALKSLLRQDPDVILIGEIRDLANAEIAIQAAQSGHLVLAAIHAGSVLGAIKRLKQLGVNLDTLLGVLSLIVFQQLVGIGTNQLLEPSRKMMAETLLLDGKIKEQIASGAISVNNIHLRTKNYCSHRSELKELLAKGLIDREQYQRYYALT